MERLICLACVVIGYGFGLFQTAYIYGKHIGVDVRSKGSGNLGTTNMFRVLGIRAGVSTFIGDLFKVFISVALTFVVFVLLLKFDIARYAIMLYTGLGAVLGHNFPFYLHFKGGKGVAASAAVIICLWDWKLIVLGIVVFFGTLLITQYVSLGSMLLMIFELAAFIVFDLTGLNPIDPAWRPDCYIIMAIMTIMVLVQHRKNISRLLKGTENKFVLMSDKELQSINKDTDSKENK
ncbi:MAG: glycerol-3-phosphate 1-O-acyltransferase PlsY [Lachnospiraceae bacterium]|nr:glycerol-3-phosphate 1-O-acyltransferase PlsY [Lachnospiraceae bacterium]